MMYIDPHAHMISRTTDDYQTLATGRASVESIPALPNHEAVKK